MARQKIVSREYKVMLRPGRFAGDEKRLLKSALALWRDFAKSIAGVVVGTTGALNRISVRRLITFVDTPKQHLNQAGYILRERRDLDKDERQITLKFRHLDRYVAEHRNMAVRADVRGRTKFEEDIKGPFVSLYSFSTTVTGEDRPLNRLKDAARMFPGLEERMVDFTEDATLSAVKGFTARELVVSGANLQIGKTPEMEAECALIVWYDHRGARTAPVAVELSYRYADDDENYGFGMSRRAFDVFGALREKLGKWIDPKPRTKTAFVFR